MHTTTEKNRLEQLFAELDGYLSREYTDYAKALSRPVPGIMGFCLTAEDFPRPDREAPGDRSVQDMEYDLLPDEVSGPPVSASASAPVHIPVFARQGLARSGQGKLAGLERDVRETFSSCLMDLIRLRGETPALVYKRAHIDRKLFSKIKTDPDYIPSKKTVISLALALKLSYEEAQMLLGRAGYTLSKGILSDVIVEFFIKKENYNFLDINEALYAYDCPVLWT